MLLPEHYFIFGSLLSLTIIGYADFKTLKIDDRRNWFMQGYCLSLALLSEVVLFYAIISIFMFVFNKILKFFEDLTGQTVFGDGDKKLLQWLVPGWIIVNLMMPGIFFTALCTVLIGLAGYKHFKKDVEKQPGVVFIAIAFLLTWGVYLLL